MKEADRPAALEGHPVTSTVVDVHDLDACPDIVAALWGDELTSLVVRGAFPAAQVEALAARLQSAELEAEWTSPNKGMAGGEIRVIGVAATPTFTHLQGPPLEVYRDSAARHPERLDRLFGGAIDPTARVCELLGRISGGRAVSHPQLPGGGTWAPFNVRALDPGERIYPHHDSHYGLPLYEHFGAPLDRTTVLSYFVTLQSPDAGGELVVYGLRGDDPDPPMLPTRFLDTEALERRFGRQAYALHPGDLVVFDSGRHVHRVTRVQGARPRLTFGGFLAVDKAGTGVVCWS